MKTQAQLEQIADFTADLLLQELLSTREGRKQVYRSILTYAAEMDQTKVATLLNKALKRYQRIPCNPTM